MDLEAQRGYVIRQRSHSHQAAVQGLKLGRSSSRVCVPHLKATLTPNTKHQLVHIRGQEAGIAGASLRGSVDAEGQRKEGWEKA